METKIIMVDHGKKKVKLGNDGFGLEMLTMKNGWQWSGFSVDDELLAMIHEAIEKYFLTENGE